MLEVTKKSSKIGILLRNPIDSKLIKKKLVAPGGSFLTYFLNKILEIKKNGFKIFVFEFLETDFGYFNFNKNSEDEIKILHDLLKDGGIRIGFYIQSGNFLTSPIDEFLDNAISEICTITKFYTNVGIPKDKECPLILHIGGAQGDRKKTMEKFCQNFERLDEDCKNIIAVINDDKPSLFSVKDLLPGIFYQIKVPVIFRTSAYSTNQGSLTLRESLYLAASTWGIKNNPIFIYLPNDIESISAEEINPYGLQLDILYDNQIPEPKSTT